MAKLLKLRRGTTSQHSSFTGAEGEVTVDTDKESLVVHNGSNAGGYPIAREDMSNVSSASIAGRLGTDAITPAKIAAGTLPTDVTVASANIVDGTIVNADVNASAAIAGTKVSPNFGSQNIVTTGTASIGGGGITLGTADSSSGHLNAYEAMTFNIDTDNDDTNRTFKFSTNGASGSGTELFKIEENGQATITGNLDVSSGVDVTGNITVSGTVDGVDVAALNASALKKDGTDNGSSTIKVNNVDFIVQDTTDAVSNFIWRDHSAQTLYLGTADAVITPRSSVVPQADSTYNIGTHAARWSNGYFDSIHGEGSNITGVNATTLDSIDSGSFVRSDADDTLSGQYTINDAADEKLVLSGSSEPFIRWKEGSTDKAYIRWDANGFFGLYNQEDGSSIRIKDAPEFSTDGSTYHSIWHAGNDGSGSGLDADTLDGIQGANFVRSDTSDTMSGSLTVTGSVTVGSGANSSDIYMNDSDETTRRIHCNSSRVGFLKSDNNWGAYCDNSGNWVAAGNVTAYSDQKLKTNVNTINDALSIVGKLRGVSFDWKADGEHSIGLIAQEVKEVLPELVVTNKGVSPVTQEIEEIKSVDYGKIVGVLINAINELKAEVDELKGGK